MISLELSELVENVRRSISQAKAPRSIAAYLDSQYSVVADGGIAILSQETSREAVDSRLGKITGLTYIRLLLEFVYLAVILDAFSRRVIGWALGRTLEAKLALEALRMALRRGPVVPGMAEILPSSVKFL